ncbi:polysaccharide deacetylase family protein [Carboxylicivirga sp. N1Y90]|uniref:polysaccharide deacetylase family protein n=1 Tax=Carboxylicivirga fragile TaxID=3417571 RepID=UPI003D32C1AD|nr:polysaccharide deacetylase family protein [Marinilabiliaceae bacterium N1Y90]
MRFNRLIVIYIISIILVFVMGQESDSILFLVGLITALFITITIIGVSVLKYNLFIKSVCNLSGNNNEIAITFDDGPCPDRTPQILDLLARYDAKATFFCIGNKIAENKAVLSRMHNEGHSIGNHSYEHSNSFPIWSTKKMQVSIIATDKELNKIGIQESNLFRPPFGVSNNLIAKAIKTCGKQCIGWSIRTKDTVKSPEQVLRTVKRKLKPGSIILLHDTNKHVCDELEQILLYCKKQKLKPIAL